MALTQILLFYTSCFFSCLLLLSVFLCLFHASFQLGCLFCSLLALFQSSCYVLLGLLAGLLLELYCNTRQ